MFGYVVPCKLELKIRDYERFKAYYCGLCHSIKKNHGNLPRLVLNYDMTFLALLLDALEKDDSQIEKFTCALHPTKKKLRFHNSKPLDYAAKCNVILAYYKLLDNAEDDKSVKSKLMSVFLNRYIKDKDFKLKVKSYLDRLYAKEKKAVSLSIDEISHEFADLTGFLMSNYFDDNYEFKEILYWLGYNIGKWIYIIDAMDDLEKDMRDNKFNLICSIYNKEEIPYETFKPSIEEKIEFILLSCASTCSELLQQLPINKNQELLYNILKFGLMEKIDIVFRRSELSNAEPL
ncbi:DUF5685 family protein [Clostridium oryzae]|uniref:Uncharacterized protein n=1 Tax=Clostridium oryzae TaxID=1450648 RepID=A0A1V4IN66_9CLOT|nr:DUF5685 family protein [Clostridium oryzae]OPJ61215.1 hypothetical protein CLORY_24270 [Clostridium oryzae]